VAVSDVRDQLQTALGTQYTLERELGRGGMATVYLARDAKHGRLVALKVLHPDLAASLGPERFRREITTAAQLQHPHILGVHDSGETPSGQLWFTMPYVEGESLRERLRRELQLSVDDALRITREVAGALDYAHGHGVIHRDIKPENILLTTQGDALLADFGIARALATSHAGAAPSGTVLTQTGLAVGTPQYMSPEQASGERELTARSDIYALGAVCYEMLAGEPPFTGPTPQAVIAKMLSSEAPPVRRTRPAVAAGVDVALRRALAPVAADRWTTAGEFARALETAERATVGARRLPVAALTLGLLTLGLGFLVGAGVLFAWRAHSRSGGGRGSEAGGGAGPIRLAVLPFENLGDSADGYFADGVTDAVRGKLTSVPGLEVIGSTSSGQYRRTSKTPQQIGQELGVRYLLIGKVRWAKNAGAAGVSRVQVTPELLDAGTATDRWAQPFDAPLTDVFQVQGDIAGKVAQALQVTLTRATQQTLAARPTQNLAAYDAYLRSTALEGLDPATVRRALAAAEQAVALDATFAAAWARVSTRHMVLYVNSIPTQADAEAARRAAERAVALAPAAPEGYMARGVYNFNIAYDVAAARAAYETAVRLGPSSSEAIRRLGEAEAAVGQWAAGLGHVRQAVALDPRSGDAARRLSRMLLYLRRYPEARAEAERGLAVAPADLALTLARATSRLGEGDLAGARAALRDIPPTLDRAALAAFMANYGDVYWALDSADRALALTLPPSAFDDDRGTWGIVRADLYWLAGDREHARVYADSARVAFETQLRATPDDFLRHQFRGLALAYLGQRAAAVHEGERGLALAQATGDEYLKVPYARRMLARISVAAGDHGKALDQLEVLLARPYFISPAWLTIDPTWAPLKGDPRFERLLAQPATGARPPA
jgi:eukaryotic-like serine/threonine-protein kinase